MDRIDKLLPTSIRKAGAAGTVKAAMVLSVVESALVDRFGAETAACMRPTVFKNHVITVRCSRAAYAQEIALHEVDLLDAIARDLGAGTVTRLRPVS